MSMYRIVGQQVINGQKFGGVLMHGERVAGQWYVSIFEARGHREVSARPVISWSEVADWQPHIDALGNPLEPEPATEEDIEEKRLRALEKAAQRAKTKCRRLIKVSDFREMLTGTYRDNQQDLELCKKHVASFIKAMQYVLPKFQYCLSFEKQDRLAYHFHAATNKLPRWVRYRGQKIEGWRLPTLIWRGIVGDDNGLVFVGGKPRWGHARRRNNSIAKIAQYVSKYITKDYADFPAGSKRYWASRDVDFPPIKKLRFDGVPIDELVRLCCSIPSGHVVVSHRIGHFQDSYWLCTEPIT